MSRTEYEFGGQSGSAARHFVVLLALTAICYFGVKAFYGRIDSVVDERRDLGQQRPASEVDETVQAVDQLSKFDKEVITRRNLFLPPSRQQSGGNLNDSVDVGGATDPDLLLIGTIIETGGLNRAVVLDVEEKKQVMLSEGEIISGVSIRQIFSGKVIISRQGRNEMLDIAEPVKIRAAIINMASTTTASNLGTIEVLPDSSLQEGDEHEDEVLRIDLNGLDSTNKRVIVKGRVSDNI